MTEDALITGAAAPTRERRITAASSLDAIWVLVASVALGVSSLFELIDLPSARLRTGEAPLRVFVVGLPLVASVIAVVAAWRRSVAAAAVATGILAPGIALAGSLSISLFLDEASAFADVGVAISLAAALAGVAMLVRWFVYHPVSLWRRERRPTRTLARCLIGAGVVAIGSVLLADLDEDMGGFAWIAQTAAVLLVPVVVVAAGILRTLSSAVLAGGACAGQVVAVVVARLELSEIAWDSDLVLRTGPVGLAALVVGAALAAASVRLNAYDPEGEPVADSDESWRWHADD